jgi:hypothetical protein
MRFHTATVHCFYNIRSPVNCDTSPQLQSNVEGRRLSCSCVRLLCPLAQGLDGRNEPLSLIFCCLRFIETPPTGKPCLSLRTRRAPAMALSGLLSLFPAASRAVAHVGPTDLLRQAHRPSRLSLPYIHTVQPCKYGVFKIFAF